ncbi:unnamed protein product [Ilex paraguariensis]|uniref:Uncharacterized protein n=1 Tax=Ilex paraguariensis TaxID=185542 RepID=A0ABC8TIN3_9AQUA
MASLLHTATIHQGRAAINRAHMLFHSIFIILLFYYRISSLLHPPTEENFSLTATTLILVSELILSFLWVLTQSFRWRPVTRSAFPERLSGDQELPAIDAFICTADPKKEPTLDVMNTVISAMSLDYPPEKLAVYVSDDGGAWVTLMSVKEAAIFTRWWIPFCRKYGIKTRCPEAYFSGYVCVDDQTIRSDEFMAEAKHIKLKYEEFKTFVKSASGCIAVEDVNTTTGQGRAPNVQIILDTRGNEDNNEEKLPLLVYVSREKRPLYPHRFKAGALNTLLRVSGIISNAPYLLVLDCDMYCNDPTSARQAMCFLLDSQSDPSLAFVQYPQVFYNVSKNDIYDGQSRSAYKTKWQGMDGLRGPPLSGTGYYLKRIALYQSPKQKGSKFPTLNIYVFFGNDQYSIWDRN